MTTSTIFQLAVRYSTVLLSTRKAVAGHVLLLALSAVGSIDVHAASPWSRLNASEPELSEELELYVSRFDAFHSVAQAFLNTCKSDVSIYQTTRLGGDHLPAAALAEGAYKDILQCIDESRDAVDDRYHDLPELSPNAEAMVGPAVRTYLSTAHQILDALTPLEEDGVGESIDAYDRRYAWMQRDLENAADEVRAAAGWVD